MYPDDLEQGEGEEEKDPFLVQLRKHFGSDSTTEVASTDVTNYGSTDNTTANASGVGDRGTDSYDDEEAGEKGDHFGRSAHNSGDSDDDSVNGGAASFRMGKHKGRGGFPDIITGNNGNLRDNDKKNKRHNRNVSIDANFDPTIGNSPRPGRGHHKKLLSIGSANLWMSVRHNSMGDHDMVPTLLEENTSLVCDPNLIGDPSFNAGTLYYAEDAFYNKAVQPDYVISMRPDIYCKVMDEVYTSHRTPCGLYFCCQGGDSAGHHGVSHDDYVSINLAWTLVGTIFGGFVILSIL